jgi:O-antigen/teichoic acid export membrane protein
MALVVTNFLDIFRDLGTRSALIQRRHLTADFVSSIFYVNLLVGVALTAGVVLAAPVIAGLYGDAQVVPVLQGMALAIVIASVGLVQQGLLYRLMAFRKLAVVGLANALVNGVTAIWLAVAGWGVWALVAGIVLGTVGQSVAAWVLSPWRPRWHFRWGDVREVAGFSLNLSASQICAFAVTNADKFLIGRSLGPGPLGYYALAQRILMYPIRSITQMLQNVLFPAMAPLQEDNAAVARAYLRSCAAIAMITLPAMIGCAVLAQPLVLAVLGPQWAEAIPIVMILAPVGALQSLNYTVSTIYMVKGRTDRLLLWTIVASVVTVAALIIGLPWGLLGVTVAFAVAIVILTYPAFALAFRLIDLRVGALVVTLLPYLIGSLLMAALVGTVRVLMELSGAPPIAVLGSGVVTGIVVYGIFLLSWRPTALGDVVSVALPSRHGRLAAWLKRGRHEEMARRPS